MGQGTRYGWAGGLLLACTPLASAATYSKTETYEYHDDTANWVLGQLKRHTVDGVEVERISFDARSQPATRHVFGQLNSVRGYQPDGQLASVQDGDGHVTRFYSYKRGIPGWIIQPDGTGQSATVDDNGWIVAVGNELGDATCFAYDAVGRRIRMTYPSESQAGVCDETAWAARQYSFSLLGTTSARPAGVAAGQWLHAEYHDQYRKLTYYDAMWRPVLVHEYDARAQAATLRTQSWEYDAQGRVVFQSYPSKDAVPPAQGTWTQYDALGRVLAVTQDSELGPLTTHTAYLAGGQTRVTHPRGQVTTTSYQVYDEPSQEWPVLVQQPEGAVTEMARDVFGKPTRITRRNSAGTQRVDRRYVYDAQQRLCKTLEPETGATVMDYTAAGQLRWTAAGLNLPDASRCDTVAAGQSGRAVERRYNARHQLTDLIFPDGRGDQQWRYTADGLPEQVVTWNAGGRTDPVNNLYVYNHRRLPTVEYQERPGQSIWALRYGYDGQGHPASLAYPTGWTVNTPHNALGQPTEVRDTQGVLYAGYFSYHPNGALKQFSYGNGVVHVTAQNLRQLPSALSDNNAVQELRLDYDASGNLTGIRDLLQGTHYNRAMEYDGLDRLTAAGSVSFGGSGWHRMRYDALDNLTSWTLAYGDKDNARYNYDAQQRLTSIQNSAGATVVGMAYDAQGNLTQRNGQYYDFDYGNRLRGATGQQSYRYDAHGRRIATLTPAGNGVLSMYGMGGSLYYEEDQLRAVQREHLHLPGRLLATRERDFGATGANIRYQHTDMLGSPVAVTSPARTVLTRTAYEPFGKVIGQPGYTGIGYTGHVHDGATGMTYMQQRYFSSDDGRFRSVDPVTAYESPGVNFNRYWYANNNPYRYTDPDGRWVCPSGAPACSNFESEIGNLDGAIQSSRISESEKWILMEARAFYGRKGDDKVHVSFDDSLSTDGAARLRDDGKHDVIFNIKKLSSRDPFGVNLGRHIVHEGWHGVINLWRNRVIATRVERMDSELSAYYAQAIFQKAVGTAFSTGDGWTPATGISISNIVRQADSSVRASCMNEAGGSCK